MADERSATDCVEGQLSQMEISSSTQLPPLMVDSRTPQVFKGRRFFSMIAILSCAFLDAIDVGLLPASFKDLRLTFNMSIFWLGASDFSTSVFIGGFAFLWGKYSDRYPGMKLLKILCFLWGVSSLLVSVASGPLYFFIVRALSGIALGGFYPIKFGLVSDLVPNSHRGFYFSLLNVFSALGHMCAGFLVAVTGSWRTSFRITGLVCFGSAAFIAVVQAPIRGGGNYAPVSSKMPPQSLREVAKIPTVWLSLCINLMFNIVKLSLHWLIFWLQLMGKNDMIAASISSVYLTGVLLGSLAGGILSDVMHRHSPNYGRIVMLHVSEFVVFLCLLFLFNGGAASTNSVLSLCLFAVGACTGWIDFGVCKPMLLDVIGMSTRGLVIGFEHFIVKVTAAFIAGPLLGTVALDAGFGGIAPSNSTQRVANVAALQEGLQLVTMGAAVLAIGFTVPIYFTYKTDRVNSTIIS